jgi:hypothetical protein
MPREDGYFHTRMIRMGVWSNDQCLWRRPIITGSGTSSGPTAVKEHP